MCRLHLQKAGAGFCIFARLRPTGECFGVSARSLSLPTGEGQDVAIAEPCAARVAHIFPVTTGEIMGNIDAKGSV